MNEALLERLGPVVKRMRRVRFFRIMAAVLLLIGLVGWLMRLQVENGRVPGSTLAWSLLGLILLSAVIAAVVCRFSFRNLAIGCQANRGQIPDPRPSFVDRPESARRPTWLPATTRCQRSARSFAFTQLGRDDSPEPIAGQPTLWSRRGTVLRCDPGLAVRPDAEDRSDQPLGVHAVADKSRSTRATPRSSVDRVWS